MPGARSSVYVRTRESKSSPFFARSRIWCASARASSCERVMFLPGTLPLKETRMCWSLMCSAAGGGGGGWLTSVAVLGAAVAGAGLAGAGLLHASVVARNPRTAATAATERFVLIGTSAAILFVHRQ